MTFDTCLKLLDIDMFSQIRRLNFAWPGLLTGHIVSGRKLHTYTSENGHHTPEQRACFTQLEINYT